METPVKSVRALGMALACAFLVAGCSGGSEAKTPPSTTEPSKLEIPPVMDPLDASAFVDDPCALLDDTQRAELNLTVATLDELDSAACNLFTTAQDTLPLRVSVAEGYGLAENYERCGSLLSVGCTGWATDTIDGYPALRVNGGTSAKYGVCTLFLGIAVDASVWFTDNQPNREADGPLCDRVDRAAAMVLATLRGRR